MPAGLEPFLFEAGVSRGWGTGIQISLKNLKLKSPELRLFAVIEVIISISFGSVSWFKIYT